VPPLDQFVRIHRRRVDGLISQAYSTRAGDPLARATFDELLHCVRARSPRYLEAPVVEGRHPALDALLNLSSHKTSYVRPIATWGGCAGSWRPAVDSLAQHLLSRYRIPTFLASSWYAVDSYAEAKRSWFVAHASGASFRSLDLPLRLTRRMEHIFLQARDHFSVEYALRRAELLALGADAALAKAVLATRPSLDLDNGDFWRTVWVFLIRNSGVIHESQVGPILDFLHGIRHERVAVETVGGIAYREPREPTFSLKGRTAHSVLGLMETWHRDLGRVQGGLSWSPSGFRPMIVDIPAEDPSSPPVSWELTELTDSEQLRAEGAALRHCVASYAHSCWRGVSRIWSLRRRRGAKVRSVATIEVNPRRRTIVQARGFWNKRLSAREMQLVRTWAIREHLRLAIWRASSAASAFQVPAPAPEQQRRRFSCDGTPNHRTVSRAWPTD